MTATGTPREQLEIAVIGLACRFPGADDAGAFWRNLRAGTDSITRFEPSASEAFGSDGVSPNDPAYVAAHGALSAIDGFDPDDFGIAPLEAALMDPQMRLALQVGRQAMADVRIVADPPASTGVFVSVGRNSYRDWLRRVSRRPTAEQLAWIEVGNDIELAAGRLAHALDLRGPCMCVQSGCSSSLVAVHVAVQHLLAYQCDVALVGGVQVQVPQRLGYLYRAGGVWSRDGYCRVFDAQGTGMVPASGAGFVVLKRHEDAQRDGDHIYAVLCGVAATNDGGKKASFSAPSAPAQRAAIELAQGLAGVAPREVFYVETHGAATPLADAIEVAALRAAFGGQAHGEHPCALGSVKANIGHAGAAAGIAGLLKTILSLHAGEVVPAPHLVAPGAELELSASPFYVSTEVKRWPRPAECCYAGVNSYGAGGTNVHVIVRGAPRAAPVAARPDAALASGPLGGRYWVGPEGVTLAGTLQPHDDGRRAPSPSSIVDIIAELTGVPHKSIAPDALLKALGVDSFLLLHVQRRIAEELGRELALPSLAVCRTVGDVLRLHAESSGRQEEPPPTMRYELVRDGAALDRAYAFMLSLDPRDLGRMEPLLSPGGQGLLRRDELDGIVGNDLFIALVVEGEAPAEVVGLLLAHRVARLVTVSARGIETRQQLTEAYVVLDPGARGRVDYPGLAEELAREPIVRELGLYPWFFKLTCHPLVWRQHVAVLANALGGTSYEMQDLLRGVGGVRVEDRLHELCASAATRARLLDAMARAQYGAVSGAALLSAPFAAAPAATATLRAIIGAQHWAPLLASMRGVASGPWRLVGFDLRWLEPVFVLDEAEHQSGRGGRGAQSAHP